jgi:hydrogenase maturation protease
LSTQEEGNTRILVAGLGSVLMGDDALGPYTVRTLEATYSFPDEVEVLDVGTPGLGFSSLLANLRALIVVDVVRSEGPAGELRLYRRDEMFRHAPQPRLNPHDPGLAEAIQALELSEEAPGDILLVGVIPEEVARGTGLTPPVQAAVPRAIEAVLAELSRLGVSATRRVDPPAPDIWWESGQDGPAGEPAS